ncbi:MAG: metallophosphoesterase family protein [Chitinophagales bacterium]
MKYIGILSDTHGILDPAVFEYFNECDEIWHAGDFGHGVAATLTAFKTLKGVYGNIDGESIRQLFPEELLFSCENIKVFITHIGGYPGHYEERALHIIKSNKPDLFITGHSHILKIVRDPKQNNLLHINPGAAGRSGFHQMRTIVRMKIDGSRMFAVEVIELGKRSSI